LPNSETTLGQLNAFDRGRFVAALGWIFEDSPWVAERAWERRPFARLDDLHAAMTSAVAAATTDEQLALLRAHPDLGARARMSRASTSEQAGAGLDRVSDADFERLQQLNAAYREKFGYPFILAVTGRTTHQILDALTRRLPADPHEELAEALRQVYRIARIRLEATIRC
jgi:2-oxo-4-hydroxy-4-carboxy-5-ureidoimidazoline decarboxylase